MHLSNEIQKRLNDLGANIELATTIDGKLPENYVLHHTIGRSFHANITDEANEFDLRLVEKDQFCFARGLFTDIDRLTSAIYLWVTKQFDTHLIKKEFEELEVFEDFEFRNPNSEIDKAWTKVKNNFFDRGGDYLQDKEWSERYGEMLLEAKKHQSFQDYFPFTSHYRLRFSIDKEIKETWTLNIHIFPVRYSHKTPKTLGKFYVSFGKDMMMDENVEFFEDIHEALDFYAKILEENKSIKWK